MEPVSTSTFRWSHRPRVWSAQSGNSFLSSQTDNATLLIVEDEAYMLRLLVRFFSRHGYHVLQAIDGEQAIELYRQHGKGIDAVLLDIRLPKKNGEQVFQEMKLMNPAVKVIIASGFLDPKVKIDMTLAGVKRFVDKPYILTEVLDIIEDMVSKD